MLALVDGLGRAVGGAVEALETQLHAFIRRAALRTTIMVMALVAFSTFLVMAAIAGYLALAQSYSEPTAAAVVALVFLVIGGVLAAIALTASLRPGNMTPPATTAADPTRDIERVVEDAAKMGSDLHSLMGRNSGSLVIGAAIAGIMFSMTAGRK